jgi:signal transduction histidine kinase/CheY-like chemotaxis protein
MLKSRQIALTSCLLGLLFVTPGCSGRGERGDLPTLTNSAQLRRLPAAEARRGYPVRLHGTVSFYDAKYHILTVQDDQGGVFVDSDELHLDSVLPGLQVDVEGYSSFDRNSPVVVKPRIRTGPLAAVPAVRTVPIRSVLDGREDFQFVEVAVYLKSISFADNLHLRFTLSGQNGRSLEAIVSTESPMPEWPAGTALFVRGVASVFRDADGNPRSARLYVSRLEDVRLATPAAPPQPATAIPDSGLPVLTQVNQVKRLTPDEARKLYPVRVRGVVNLYLPQAKALFIQDSTGGIYVTLQGAPAQSPAPGAQVEITGLSHPGEFAPSIQHAKVRVMSAGRFFPPVEIVHPGDLHASAENSWARVRGVVRNTTVMGNLRARFDLEVDGRHFPVDTFEDLRPKVYSHWIDAELEFEGVLGALFDQNRNVQGFHLMVPEMKFARVLRPAPTDPFAMAALPVTQVFQFGLDDLPRHRVKVEGTVTAIRHGGSVYLATGGTVVRLKTDGGSRARVGDRVEAVGFLPLGAKVQLFEEVQLRVVSSGPPETATPSSAEDLPTGAMDSRLVSVEAHLLARRSSHGDEVLSLRAGKASFTAVLEAPRPFSMVDALRPESLLRLTGVCDTAWDTTRVPPEPISFRLLLRSPSDIVVLQQASWWTASNTLGVLASVCFLMVIVLAWVFALQRRINHQTALIAAKLERETQLQAQLAQAQKLESIGRLAGGIAHDFNNLLTVINGYSDLALARLYAGDPLRPQLEQIRRAGERAAVLTQQLLGFSRKQHIQPRAVNLNAIVSEARTMLQPLVGELIRVNTVLQPGLSQVMADPGQIDQILMNLAANARDAMPGGGTLTIGTHDVTLERPVRNADEEIPLGRYAVLTVSDTGTGMSLETQRHMFEPFFTTKEQGKGTGLGLATVYGIVKQNGGWIAVQSEDAKGTAFQIYFPSIAEASAVGAPPESPAVADGSERILVVEDQEDVRSFAVEVLKSRGYTVLASENGEAALKLVASSSTPIHLLLSDVILPGMNGKDLADRLKAIRPEMEVLFTSGYTRDVIAQHGILEPGIAYIAKPFTPDGLATKVHQTLSKSSRSTGDTA